MNLARVIGTVWATVKDPSLSGLGMRILQPLDFERNPQGDAVVATDSVGAGAGELVLTVSAREATLPFDPPLLPVDLAIVGIVDSIDLHGVVTWRKHRDSS